MLVSFIFLNVYISRIAENLLKVFSSRKKNQWVDILWIYSGLGVKNEHYQSYTLNVKDKKKNSTWEAAFYQSEWV